VKFRHGLCHQQCSDSSNRDVLRRILRGSGVNLSDFHRKRIRNLGNWTPTHPACGDREEEASMTTTTLDTKVHDFLAQKRIAVAGVSRDNSHHPVGNLIYRRLKKTGHDVVAVNPHVQLDERFTASRRVLPSTRYQRDRWRLPDDVRRRRRLRSCVHAVDTETHRRTTDVSDRDVSPRTFFAGVLVGVPFFDENSPLRNGIRVPVQLENGSTRLLPSPVTNSVTGAMAPQEFGGSL